MTKSELNTLGHKGSFIETINNYLAKIVNNERLFYMSKVGNIKSGISSEL